MPEGASFAHLWDSLFWPMLRLVLGLAAGMLVANLLECLHWTRHLAAMAAPLARLAHLQSMAAASFALACVSPAAANGLLAEHHSQGRISEQELLLTNLFNSLPSYLVHTPTIFFLTYPVLGAPAFTYVGLTLLAAAARTLFTVVLARTLLPLPAASSLLPSDAFPPISWSAALRQASQRFRQRIPKLISFTIPIYLLMYLLQQHGFFLAVEAWMAEHAHWLSFLKPQAMGIVALHLAAELGAALSAAGSVLHTGGLDARDVVLALLVGNILSTPMRAVRHQLPSYAGFYRPRMALILVLTNQGLRALSLMCITLVYAL